MRITWNSVIFSGILASIATAFFFYLIPLIMGGASIDIIREMGTAFSASAPMIPGVISLALVGIAYSAIFAMSYNAIPGNGMMKGIIYGLIIGLVSLFVLPSVMTTLDGMFGAPNQFAVESFALKAQVMLSIIAFALFGATLSSTYRPAEG